MDQKKPYEQTITSKLEALPLPNMADAIWARIEAGLDSDIPGDDDDGGNGPDAPRPRGWKLPVSFVIIGAAIVTVFLLNKNSSVRDNISPVSPGEIPVSTNSPAIIQPATPPANRQQNQQGGQSPGITFAPRLSSQDSLNAGKNDSLAFVPIIPNVSPDSSLKRPVSPPIVVATDTPPPGKKSKGVKGVTDDDYKIVPAKKDSTR
ncbi:MAG TPA: hypothetical protein VGD17_04895 [Chitinophagaceae bacterium]